MFPTASRPWRKLKSSIHSAPPATNIWRSTRRIGSDLSWKKSSTAFADCAKEKGYESDPIHFRAHHSGADLLFARQTSRHSGDDVVTKTAAGAADHDPRSTRPDRAKRSTK